MINVSKKIKVLGLEIYCGKLEELCLNNKFLVNTISPNSFAISEKDKTFKDALKNTDILVLDGLYFGLAPLLLRGIKVKKNSGTDCFYYFLSRANEISGKVFFLGASLETLVKMEKKARIDYPSITTESYAPPFRESFTKDDNEKMIKVINQFNPDILFIGMTAPKQEKWAYEHKDKINANIICTVGNVFDWFADNQKRPGKIWIKLGLEWFIRTIRRPEILKRYPNVFKFFWILFLNIIRIRKD
ncbi:MAG: hypothetical protein A2057_10735 [Ignavibacteria bacterium GWA2_35_9]|nr:MAG: hypothetical protein A2057_10735 [Ignavibacteria bacterium GWA2_35_9]OGU43958.1 MAG: hypothetical protein A2000_01015 [Ignavibacteria bacterium GWB2_36_8]OGU53769.1 MAG: hypothetical protein A2080_06095 [Ignavibacteria bacterium GWC2_36_12]